MSPTPPQASTAPAAWPTAAIDVEPFAMYRVAFQSRSARPALWGVTFVDAAGRELIADHHSGIDASEDWRENEAFVMAREGSVRGRLGFLAPDGPLEIRDASLTPATPAQVLAWADRLYASLPPVAPQLLADRLRPLARTMERLRAGRTLRVVALGDSIVNDTCNSHFHLLLQRRYPGSAVQILPSVGGSKGCWHYQEEDRVRSHVIDLHPDLLIIAGASHRFDAAAVLAVIAQVRRHIDLEILAMSGAMIPMGYRFDVDSAAPARAKEAAFFGELARAAKEGRFAAFDMRDVWERYLDGSSRPFDWYMRDELHANDRGAQILGRIMEAFFAL